jgi:hypothetical protein
MLYGKEKKLMSLGRMFPGSFPIDRAHVAVAFLLGRLLERVHHCSRVMTRGIDSRVLDGVNVWSLAGFGWESFAWVRYHQRTGDGRFDGETFLGGLLIFFLGGRGDKRKKAQGHGKQGRSLDDARFQTVPFCYILYIVQWKFRCSMRQTIAKGVPDPHVTDIYMLHVYVSICCYMLYVCYRLYVCYMSSSRVLLIYVYVCYMLLYVVCLLYVICLFSV